MSPSLPFEPSSMCHSSRAISHARRPARAESSSSTWSRFHVGDRFTCRSILLNICFVMIFACRPAMDRLLGGVARAASLPHTAKLIGDGERVHGTIAQLKINVNIFLFTGIIEQNKNIGLLRLSARRSEPCHKSFCHPLPPGSKNEGPVPRKAVALSGARFAGALTGPRVRTANCVVWSARNIGRLHVMWRRSSKIVVRALKREPTPSIGPPRSSPAGGADARSRLNGNLTVFKRLA